MSDGRPQLGRSLFTAISETIFEVCRQFSKYANIEVASASYQTASCSAVTYSGCAFTSLS